MKERCAPGEEHAHEEQQQIELDEGGDGGGDERERAVRGDGGEERHGSVTQPAAGAQSKGLVK